MNWPTLNVGCAVLLLILSGSVSAQTPPITLPPPPVVFPSWTKVGTDGSVTEYLVRFPSALPSGVPENDSVPVHIFLPNSEHPMPAVIVLHYWGATDLQLERSLSMDLAKRGIASAVMELPYHLSRTPPGYRSGALAVQADPAKLVQTMTQSVLDVRRTLDLLASEPEIDKDKIGIAGTSLGSLVAILSFGVEPRLKCGAFILCGVDLAHIIWTSSRVVREREQLRSKGYDEQRLQRELQPIEPSVYLKGRSGPTLVVGAKYDTVIPPDSTKALIRDLPQSKTLWLDSGHYGGMFAQRPLLSEVSKFFKSAFDDAPFTIRPVQVPTMRIGAGVATGDGFDIEFGFDLMRPQDERSAFASLLLAPRGVSLFGGFGVDRGLAAGVFAKSGRIGVGFLWSIVL